MYCNKFPQPSIRCEECWKHNGHTIFCSSRVAGAVLDFMDPSHSKQTRLTIEVDPNSNDIRSYKQRSIPPVLYTDVEANNTDQILLFWEQKNMVKFIGPKTMYFRVVIVTDDMVHIRIDVAFEGFKIRLIDRPIRELKSHFNPLETVAVLRVVSQEQTIVVRMAPGKEFDKISLRMINGQIMVGDRITVNE